MSYDVVTNSWLLRMISYSAVANFLAAQNDVIWCCYYLLAAQSDDIWRQSLVYWLLRMMSYGVYSILAAQNDVIIL